MNLLSLLKRKKKEKGIFWYIIFWTFEENYILIRDNIYLKISKFFKIYSNLEIFWKLKLSNNYIYIYMVTAFLQVIKYINYYLDLRMI